jgi:hypothetical protein
MQINNGVIVLDEPISDDMAEEFYTTISQSDINKVVIENPQISASIMQILFCFNKKHKVECKDEFLNKFFSNISYLGDND